MPHEEGIVAYLLRREANQTCMYGSVWSGRYPPRPEAWGTRKSLNNETWNPLIGEYWRPSHRSLNLLLTTCNRCTSLPHFWTAGPGHSGTRCKSPPTASFAWPGQKSSVCKRFWHSGGKGAHFRGNLCQSTSLAFSHGSPTPICADC